MKMMHSLPQLPPPACRFIKSALFFIVAAIPAHAQDYSFTNTKINAPGKYQLTAAPSYAWFSSKMSVGLDGKVLLTCSFTDSMPSNGFLWILDSTGKTLGMTEDVGRTVRNATSNAKGIVALVVQHSDHAVVFYDAKANMITEDSEYSQGREYEGAGFANPQSVRAGPSGKFYAYDLYGKQIVVYSDSGKRESAIPLQMIEGGELEFVKGQLYPDEKNKRFFLIDTKGFLHLFDAEGKMTGSPHKLPGISTVTGEGRVYSYNASKAMLVEISPDAGDAIAEIPIEHERYNENDPDTFEDFIGIHGDKLFLHRHHPYELFKVYDVSSGSLLEVINAEHTAVE